MSKKYNSSPAHQNPSSIQNSSFAQDSFSTQSSFSIQNPPFAQNSSITRQNPSSIQNPSITHQPSLLIRQILSWPLNAVHQSWGLVFLSAGIILGMILGLVFRINFFASPIWLLLVAIIFIIMYLKPQFFTIGLCFLAGMILAFFRVASELNSENYIRQFHGHDIIISGTIDGDPETDGSTTKLKLTNLSFEDNSVHTNSSTLKDNSVHTDSDTLLDGSTSADLNTSLNSSASPNTPASLSGSFYISLSKNESLSRGDIITLSGKLSEGFGTYSGYMYRPKAIQLKKPDPQNFVVSIRNWFAIRIKSLIPEKEVNLGLSYLLGMKTNLDEDLSENLRIVGLTHIVVASGAHLSILVEIARKLFGKISRAAGLILSILFIVFFMAMVGWTPSILRAGLMSILTLISWYVGRKIAPLRLILMIAAVTLIMNPMFLINLGWLLSFASYAGIMLLGPRLTKFFYGEKKPGFISSMALTTLSATLLTLPITLYYYGQVSIISVIANLLILPTLSYAMGLVFLTGALAGLPLIETVVSFLAEKLLDYHIFIIDTLSNLKQFLIKIETYDAKVFLLYLIIIIPCLYFLIRKIWKLSHRSSIA